jgi:hypothetical protein
MGLNMSWELSVRNFLKKEVNDMYSAWISEQPFKVRMRIQQGRVSPYRKGFSLPNWVHETIKALNKNDKEQALGLMHAVSKAGIKYGEL